MQEEIALMENPFCLLPSARATLNCACRNRSGVAMRADASAISSSLCALALAATLGLPLTVSGAGEPSWSQEELGKAARAQQEIDPGVQEAIDRGDLKTLRVLLKKLNYYKGEPQIKVYAFQVAVSLGNVAVVEYLAGLGWLDECRKPNPAGCELVPFAAQHGRIGMIKVAYVARVRCERNRPLWGDGSSCCRAGRPTRNCQVSLRARR